MRRFLTMISALIPCAVILCAPPAAAWAEGCGPTRLKVTESVALDAPPAKVWAVVGNFQDMSWDPDTVATTGSGGNDPEKALRTLRLKGGAAFGESLYKYDAAAMSYSYHIDKIDVTRLPVQNVSATVEVVAEDGGTRTIVRWKSVFYRYLAPGEGAPDVADAKAIKAVRAFLHSALEGLKARTDSKT